MTAQLREKLILDGKLVGMAFCPPLPKHDPRLVERTDEEIAALRKRTSASLMKVSPANPAVNDRRAYGTSIDELGSAALPPNFTPVSTTGNSDGRSPAAPGRRKCVSPLLVPTHTLPSASAKKAL